MRKILILLLCLTMLCLVTSCAKTECTLIYHTGNDQTVADSIVEWENLSSFTLPVVSKAGYVFEGWYVDEAMTVPFDPAAVQKAQHHHLLCTSHDVPYAHQARPFSL